MYTDDMISVLIVEDDAFIRDITTIKFTEHAYEVVASESSESALQALDKQLFDVILLDLDLPGMSGYELLSFIKAHRNGTGAKIVVFSNNDDDILKQKITEFGILGFFAKSSTHYEELFALIDDVHRESTLQ